MEKQQAWALKDLKGTGKKLVSIGREWGATEGL